MFDCSLHKLCLSFLKYVFFIKKIKSSDEIVVISYVITRGMKGLCFYLGKKNLADKFWFLSSSADAMKSRAQLRVHVTLWRKYLTVFL